MLIILTYGYNKPYDFLAGPRPFNCAKPCENTWRKRPPAGCVMNLRLQGATATRDAKHFIGNGDVGPAVQLGRRPAAPVHRCAARHQQLAACALRSRRGLVRNAGIARRSGGYGPLAVGTAVAAVAMAAGRSGRLLFAHDRPGYRRHGD